MKEVRMQRRSEGLKPDNGIQVGTAHEWALARGSPLPLAKAAYSAHESEE